MGRSNKGKREARDFDLNKEPTLFDLNKEPTQDPDECHKITCTAPDSSHDQVAVENMKDAKGKGKIAIVDSSIIIQTDNVAARLLEQRLCRNQILNQEAASNLLAPQSSQWQPQQPNRASVLIEKSAADGAAPEKPVLTTEQRRQCTRYKRGTITTWRCREYARPGYLMCSKHITQNRECMRRWREVNKKNLPNDGAAESIVVSTLAADNAAPSMTGVGWNELAAAVSTSPKPLVISVKKRRTEGVPLLPSSSEDENGASSSVGELFAK